MPINLQLTEPNFTRIAGYFYHLDVNGSTLYKKTDDGNNAFSYPLDTAIANPIESLQYDGRYFYTLENLTDANTNKGQLIFKRWEIQDYVLRFIKSYTLNGSVGQRYDSSAFGIEHHELVFSGIPANSGSTSIRVSGDMSTIVPGDILYMGPSSFTGNIGQYQERTVTSITGNLINLSLPLTASFNGTTSVSGADSITFSNNCWFFNSYKPNETISGASGGLFSFNLNSVTPTPMFRKVGSEFANALAATFMRDSYFGTTGRSFLTFVNQTNLLFLEVDPTNPGYLTIIQSAAQNNQETTNAVIPIYEITNELNTIFRLQHKGTFRNGDVYTTEDWGTNFNYQLSTLLRLPTSISLSADNGVVATSGSTSVHIMVHDQFDQGMAGRAVTVTENDNNGTYHATISGSPATTAGGISAGQATVIFKAGTNPMVVQVTATTS